jgi:hypothetical protein
MKKTYKKQPKHRLLKAGCVGAGLLSISNPTQVTAADIGILDVHDFGAPPVSLGTISNPFPGSTLGVHVAVGDIDGDGFGDIVIGPGKGATEVYIHRGKSDDQSNKKLILSSFSPGAGVRVATGDLDGDGLADIIATPATGASSRGAFLKFDGIKGELALLEEFDDIFDGPSGGVSVATGDLDGDGVTDIMAGQVTVNKAKMADKALGAAFTDFGDPLPDGNGGVQVAAGDVDGDGLADVLVLPNNSPTGLVQPLLATSKGKHTPWILLPSIDEPTGVHVALGDVDGDGLSELVVGSARGSSPYIKIYGIDYAPGLPGTPDVFGTYIKIDIPLDGHSYSGGIRVAVGDVNGDGFGDLVYGPASIPEPSTIASVLTGLGAWIFRGRWRRRSESPPG